jgi:hypothetical protein
MLITNDGMSLLGQTAAEQIDLLHATSFSPCPNRRKFMAEVASRVLLQTGRRVRTSTPEMFIEDLLAAGMLREEDEGDHVQG